MVHTPLFHLSMQLFDRNKINQSFKVYDVHRRAFDGAVQTSRMPHHWLIQRLNWSNGPSFFSFDKLCLVNCALTLLAESNDDATSSILRLLAGMLGLEPCLGLEASRGQTFVASASASRVLASASRVWPRRGRDRGDNNNNYYIIILNCCIHHSLLTVLTLSMLE